MTQNAEVAAIRQSIFVSVDRLLELLDGLNEQELNWRPAVVEANSLHSIAMHVVGSIELRTLHTIGGQTVQRDRQAELDAHGVSATVARERWRSVRERAGAVLDALPAGSLERDYDHSNLGRMTGRELLHHLARHAAEHLGEASLTLSLLKTQHAAP